LYATLLTTIRKETGTTNHTTTIIEIVLDKRDLLPQKRQCRGKKNEQEVKHFDLDEHMKNYSRSEDQVSTADNDDIPQLLQITINRFTIETPTVVNDQPIKFSETITVPTTFKDTTMQYILIGYVCFRGDTTSGHYKVICREEARINPSWFLYNDEDTRELNVVDRGNDCYKREVVFLLYAQEQYYYNDVSIDGAI